MLLLPATSSDRADVLRCILQSFEDSAGCGVQLWVLTHASTELPMQSRIAVKHIYRESGTDTHEVLIVDRKVSLEYGIRDGHDAVSIYCSSPSTAKSFVTMFDKLWLKELKERFEK